jgi:hypothetical protein
MPPEYNGSYSILHDENIFLEGNRPVFEKNGICLWWHHQYRHWWIGPCENVGSDDGYAFAEEDFDCPSFEQTWRRGGSNEILHDAHVSIIYVEAQAVSHMAEESSATAGVNAIIRNGHYKQICRPVYRSGRFRCP